jgi:lysyl-tRNA synthetase class 2
VPSTAIRRFDYDPRACRLDIRFVSGGTYSYFEVPEAVATGLRTARSKGRYFQQYIRGRFEFRKDRSGEILDEPVQDRL